jgi:hypothetical protein
MARERPTELSVVGWAGVVAGLVWLLWLTVGRWGENLDLVRAGVGSAVSADRLRRGGLAGAGLYFAVPTLVLELALALLLAVTGAALLGRRPFARRAALVACAAVVFVEGFSTLLRIVFLASPSQPIRLGPVVVNGLVTLGALALWGSLYLPGVHAAYAEAPEGPPAAAP